MSSTPYKLWMATFKVDEKALRELLPLLAPIAHSENLDRLPGVVVVDVVVDETNSVHAVLFATADSAETPKEFRCWAAFCNDVRSCDFFRGFGLPMIEADLRLSNGVLDLHTNVYPGRGAFGMRQGRLLRIEGVTFETADVSPSTVVFKQYVTRPDLDHPGRSIVATERVWTVVRNLAQRPNDDVKLVFERVAFPDFGSLWGGSDKTVTASPIEQIYSGTQVVPTDASGAITDHSGLYLPIVPMQNAGTVGEPNYVFKDMELFGFRIDLPAEVDGLDDALADLIKPLNFHRNRADESGQMIDFEYRVATRSIIVELLRYGKMQYRDGCKPLSADHYMSQHELLVRVLVGRVDEDSVQARDPATYVAAIFVDNPASKAVGREMQGYPKELAHFCQVEGSVPRRVAQDGTDPGHPEVGVPLARIRSVYRAVNLAAPDQLGQDQKVFSVSYSESEFADSNLKPINATTLAGAAELARLPWRQDDFEDPAFRRAFARQVVGERFQRSRSVQVVPIMADSRNVRTWLTGTFQLTDIRLQRPSGIATLNLYNQGATMNLFGAENWSGWNALCSILIKCYGTSSVSLPSGDWYRLRANMDLTIDDGLAW